MTCVYKPLWKNDSHQIPTTCIVLRAWKVTRSLSSIFLQGFFQKPWEVDGAGTGIHSQRYILLVQNAGLCGWTSGSFPHTRESSVGMQDEWCHPTPNLWPPIVMSERLRIFAGGEAGEKLRFPCAQYLQPGKWILSE